MASVSLSVVAERVDIGHHTGHLDSAWSGTQSRPLLAPREGHPALSYQGLAKSLFGGQDLAFCLEIFIGSFHEIGKGVTTGQKRNRDL